MKAIHHLFNDDRLNDLCTYCGKYGDTRDHTPSKALLDKPFPDNLPTVPACQVCNESFSFDEEYVACFLDCVLNGSTSLDSSINERTKSRFTRKPRLQNLIEQSKVSHNTQLSWQIDEHRFKNVILKLAKGHACFENSEQQFENPAAINYSPIICLTEDQIYDFETKWGRATLFPEIGSRGFIRRIESNESAWLIVQPNIYRYSVVHLDGGLLVQMVLREYIACEVYWE